MIKAERDRTHMAPLGTVLYFKPGFERKEGLGVNQSLN